MPRKNQMPHSALCVVASGKSLMEEHIAFEPLLFAQDAAKLLRIHPVTLMRWTREGRVPHLCLGRTVRFGASELDAWCEEHYHGGAVRAAQP